MNMTICDDSIDSIDDDCNAKGISTVSIVHCRGNDYLLDDKSYATIVSYGY